MKRLLTLALAAVFAIGCLAGCGDSKPSDASGEPSISVKTEDSGVTGTETVAPTTGESGEFDLANYKIDLTNHLVNPNATDSAKAVYNFIRDIRGKYIISGQQESPNASSPEISDIFKATGTTPVLRGFDFINDDFDGVVMRAESWWSVGGLVTICWHMGTPPDGIGYDSSKGRFDVKKALQEGTTEHEQLMAYFDMAVPSLKKLQEDGIAVLWRPFHEADGGWFWWGKAGGESFIELWKLMYNYYTIDCGLNNLIWVCGLSGQAYTNRDWYPGDDYVDIFGADLYAHTHDSQAGLYRGCAEIAPNKPICLHENGMIPDPNIVKEDGAEWSWFMTWTSKWLHENDDVLNEYYNNDYLLAMNRMPNITEQIDALK